VASVGFLTALALEIGQQPISLQVLSGE